MASLSEFSSVSLPSLLSSPRALREPLRPPQQVALHPAGHPPRGTLPGQGHLPRPERKAGTRGREGYSLMDSVLKLIVVPLKPPALVLAMTQT